MVYILILIPLLYSITEGCCLHKYVVHDCRLVNRYPELLTGWRSADHHVICSWLPELFLGV